MISGDKQIIRNNNLRKPFINGVKYREIKPIKFEIAKCCILAGLKIVFHACFIKTVLINLPFWNGKYL